MDYRWPIFDKLPIKHKSLCLEPLISHIDLPKLRNIEKIICGGESGYGPKIRPCDESWVRDLYNQSHELGIPFCFKQTGTYFYLLDQTKRTIARRNQFEEAKKLHFQDFSIDSL